jgi:hypothetical protein
MKGMNLIIEIAAWMSVAVAVVVAAFMLYLGLKR